ncbi:MAG: DNA-binding Lrp family transcriptional regulator [Chitinophagales bacterium]|jgi:DNA-binding Lrp family transcriptional regulator|tara:strand:+ start:13802 stop:14230 length:429 start_codon:yes stop_codon:yes gene_type:complete
MIKTDALDRQLLTLLSHNSRESITALARQLKVSRATAQDRLTKLEKAGVITGYTVAIDPDFAQQMISAHSMITVDPKKYRAITLLLKKIPAVQSIYSVNGEYDLMAVLQEPTTQELDAQLEEIGNIDGVIRTSTLILLSKLH